MFSLLCSPFNGNRQSLHKLILKACVKSRIGPQLNLTVPGRSNMGQGISIAFLRRGQRTGEGGWNF